MAIDLKKAPYKGPYSRDGLIKQSTARLVTLGIFLGLDGNALPDDKNKLVSVVLQQFNAVKVSGGQVIEGPLTPEDEALVTGKGTVTGEGTGEAVNMKGATDSKDPNDVKNPADYNKQFEGDEDGEEPAVLEQAEIDTMDNSLKQSGVVKGLLDRVTALEGKVVTVKDPSTLHGHVDDLKHS